MPRVTLVKKAQKDIYSRGKRVDYISKIGKKIGQTLSKIDRTIPFDENDSIFIKKGESYYWWMFKNSPKSYSKTQPRQSQLTKSEYLSTLYTISESVSDFHTDCAEDLSTFIEEIKEQVSELKEQTEESLENVPENLKYAPVGELLQERIDELETVYDELDSIEIEYDEPDDETISDELSDEHDIHIDAVTDEMISEKKSELLNVWLEEKMEELQNISI